MIKKHIIFKWLKPVKPWLKLNIDGSSFGNPGPAGAGGLLRDHSGAVLFTFSCSLGFQSAFMAELAAVHEGLQICKRISVRKVWIETDSMVLATSLLEDLEGNWQSFNLLRRIKLILSNITWQCSHVWREGNQAADLLARAGVTAERPLITFAPLLRGRLKGINTLDIAGMEQIRIAKEKGMM